MKTLTLIYFILSSATTIFSIHLITTKDYDWYVKSETSCSRPCDGGVKKTTYQCVEYDDPTGLSKYVDDAQCAHVKKPPQERPCNLDPCKPNRGKRNTKQEKDGRYKWLFTDQWSHCAKNCLKVDQTCKMQDCYDSKLDEWVNQSFCKNIRKKESVCASCGETINCPPMWTKTPWSECTATCGRGVVFRQITCRSIMRRLWVTHEDSACREARPHAQEYCQEVNCPVKYITTKWSRCVNAKRDSCGIGTRSRKVFCTRKNRIGKIEKMNTRKCFNKHGKPPVMWQRCRDYKIPLTEKCKASMKKVKISIVTNNATIMQMKRSKRLVVQAGETAYAFLRTTVIVRCPVIGFEEGDLQWEHNGKTVKFTGRRRIHVNYRGRLKIKRLKRKDLGQWRCIAKNESAAVNIKLRHPTEGFREYVVRLPIITNNVYNQMLSDSPGEGFVYNEDAVQWVASKWSACSLTCGKRGFMHRKVTCERLKDKFYKIYDDSFCIKRGLKKPNTTRDCGIPPECPKWKVNPKPGVCTDECVEVGRARLKGKLSCRVGNQQLPKSSCNQNTKPKGYSFCNNTECYPQWKASEWSQCSRSCGGRGVMSRQLQCIWKKSKRNAGGNCYSINLKPPRALTSCASPKCILACVDISKNCNRFHPRVCRYVMFQNYCCETCVRIMKSTRRRLV